MSTIYLNDPRKPGTCQNCSFPKDHHHSIRDVCDSSRVLVWRTLRSEELAIARLALEKLKDFHLANNAHLRIVDRGATGDDDWSHAYGYETNTENTHAVVLDSWARQYSGTLKDMSTAWEFFHLGWSARGAVPTKVDLKHQSEWILRVGTMKTYMVGNGEVSVVHYAYGKDGFDLTPKLDDAHGFRSRREATDCLNQVHAVHSRGIVDVWDPHVAQRANMQ